MKNCHSWEIQYSCTVPFHKRYSKNNNPLSANPTKWTNTLKQFVGNFQENDCRKMIALKHCLSLARCSSQATGKSFRHHIPSLFHLNTIFTAAFLVLWIIYSITWFQIVWFITVKTRVREDLTIVIGGFHVSNVRQVFP